MEAARTFLHPADVQVLIFHSPCNDGHGAAAIFHNSMGDFKITYIGLHPKDKLLTEEILRPTKDKNVLFVDICFSPEEMVEFCNNARKTLVLDHHITNQEIGFVNSNKFHAHFVMGKAGIALMWEYVWSDTRPCPRGLHYIALKDVWQHQDNEDAIHFNIGFTRPTAFENWRFLMDSAQDARVQAIVDKGKVLFDYQKDIYKTLMEKVRYTTWRDYRIAMVNVPFPFNSDIGALMCDKEPKRTIAVIWNKPGGEPYSVSLRTHDKVGPNVSDIAREFKGGGHVHSAGLRLEQPPWEIFTDTNEWINA